MFVKKKLSNSKEENKNLFIKIHSKSNKKLYSLKNNSTKNINQSHYNTNNKKLQIKNNLPENMKNNYIKIKNSSKLSNSNNLILTKKTFQSNRKCSFNDKKIKITLFNPISKLNDYNFNFLESHSKKNKINKKENLFDYKNKKMEKKIEAGKYNKKKSNNKLQNSKKDYNFDESSREIKSVEEIHFLYVYVNQRKKEYFQKINK